MKTGSIKYFDHAKGYGFIIPAKGGDDVFFHATGVFGGAKYSLIPGVLVSYEPDMSTGNERAMNVQLAGNLEIIRLPDECNFPYLVNDRNSEGAKVFADRESALEFVRQYVESLK